MTEAKLFSTCGRPRDLGVIGPMQLIERSCQDCVEGTLSNHIRAVLEALRVLYETLRCHHPMFLGSYSRVHCCNFEGGETSLVHGSNVVCWELSLKSR